MAIATTFVSPSPFWNSHFGDLSPRLATLTTTWQDYERNESCARLPVVRAPFKLDFKIRALSCWFIKTTLLPPANKASLSFLSLQNICCKLLHHSPSLLLTAVIQGRHKMKLPSPCGARIWKPFSTFSMGPEPGLCRRVGHTKKPPYEISTDVSDSLMHQWRHWVGRK